MTAQQDRHLSQRRRRRATAAKTPAVALLIIAGVIAAAAATAPAARAAQPDPMPAPRFADTPVPRLVPASSRPKAAFSATVDHAAATSASVLIPVTLDASASSSAPNGNGNRGIQSYEWTVLRWRQDQDVGAAVRRLSGRTASVPLAPNYTYSVDLAVTDGAGERGFAAGPVWVEPQAPAVASAAAPAVGPAPKVVISSPAALQATRAADGGRVALDGSRSRPGTTGAALASYAWRAWRLSDGEPVAGGGSGLPASGARVPSAALPGGQAYTVELTVRDAAGNVGVGSAEVYVGKPGQPIPATTSATGA